MAVDYARGLPRDNGNFPMQEFPAPVLAKEQYTSENATTSSVITVTQDTVQLEVAAIGQSAALRWVATTDTEASVVTIAGATANYDHVIPSGSFRRFVIPRETIGQTSRSSMVGANRLNGLYRRVAVKSIGVGSVMVSEF